MYAISTVGRAPRVLPGAQPAPAGAAPDGADADQAEVAAGNADVRSLAAALAEDRALRQRQQMLLDRQREAFDFMMEQRAELERERNALMALATETRKHDDELLKEWIRLV